MDSQDQGKIETSPSGHESHGVYVCHKCGWPFPNPHPSARHRRAHKRICGTIEGYKPIDSEEHTHLSVSGDEQFSDDDQQTPSPKIENRGIKEIGSGGIGERSNRSVDEVFSDAVTEFSDSGFEEHLEGGRELDKNVEKIVEGDQGTSQLLKVDAIAATMHPPNNLANTSPMHNPEVLERATNELGSTTPIQDIVPSCTIGSTVSSASDTRTEELAVGLSSINGSVCDLPPVKSETLPVAPKEYINANVGDNGMKLLMTCHGQETDENGIEENNIDKILSDDVSVLTSKTASEASKLPEMDGKTSDLVRADRIVESKEEQSEGSGPKMSEHDLCPEVESVEHMEAFVNTVQVKADSAQGINVGSHGGLVEVSNTKGEGNEDLHVLSVANDMPVVDCPEIMIEDFKDHKAVESNLPLTLGPGDVIRFLEDDTKDTVYEECHSNSDSSKPGESINMSPADTNSLEEDGGNRLIIEEVPVEGEADTSKFKVMSGENLGSSGLEAPLDTIRTETEKGQTNHHFKGLEDLSDPIPIVTSVDDKVNHSTNLSGGDNADDHELDNIEKFDRAGNDSSKGAAEGKLSANEKMPPESPDSLSVTKVDQVANLLEHGDTRDREMAGIEFSDIAGNESTEAAEEEKDAVNTKTTLESACHISESQVVEDNGMDKVVTNLQETESTYLDGVLESSQVIGTSDSNSRDCQDEDNNEVLPECIGAVNMVAESNHDGDVEVLLKSSENFNLKKPEPLPVDSQFTIKNSATVEDSHSRDDGRGVSGVSSEHLQEEGGNLTKQPVGVSAVGISVDSSSQTDSLEGNWGSVSGLSTQSNAPTAIDAEALPSTDSQAPEQSEKANLQKPKTASEDKTEVLAECVGAVNMAAESNHDGDVEVLLKSSENFNLKKTEPLPLDSQSTIKTSAVEDSHSRDDGRGVSSEPLQEEGENLTKQPVGVSAVDISVDSSSQTDSLECNWGSVSVLSDAPAAVDAEALPSTDSQAPEQSEKSNLQKPKTASEGHRSNKSDVFEHPSFMTLVESGGGVDQKDTSPEIQNTQQPKSDASQAGWFPSLTNVVNESQGRKKNEEIIAKVTSWSTSKQHTPLKSLLGEANLETKPKSPNPKQSPTVIRKDEAAAVNNGASATTVNSIPGPAKRDAGKEWNSPAMYPIDNKKEKRKVKGKPYWVPFACCSSVN